MSGADASPVTTPGEPPAERRARVSARRRRLPVLLAAFLLVTAACLLWTTGCDSGDSENADGSTTSSTGGKDPPSGDVDGYVGKAIKLGDAVMTVRALQATFQPAMPEQRLSEQTPAAPASGESFYQAYVRVENKGVSPLRVDANDFACAVGDSLVNIEPTRSGPFPRSLLKNTSLDLLLTFKAPTGYEPILLYSPSWYEGTVRVSPELEETTTTTT